jgi:hypothetical protein
MHHNISRECTTTLKYLVNIDTVIPIFCSANLLVIFDSREISKGANSVLSTLSN